MGFPNGILSRALRHLRVSLVFSILAISCVGARADGPGCFHARLPSLTELLLKPPCDSCVETKAELDELQILDVTRSVEQEEHARGDHERSTSRFLSQMHVQVDEAQLAKAAPFFQCVYEAVEDAVNPAKDKFKRMRPYNLPDNGLHPLKKISAKDTFSYPSGHAAYGATVGLILIEMVPELREKIYARIEDFGFSRMISGVHFRSDVYAGEVAGTTIAASLHQAERFQAQFDDAKKSVRKALGY
jgi:acid phosphatase (class A)